MLRDDFFEVLKFVKQPQRYLGIEKGFILKENPSVKVLLIFPDLYEIGMSHYGFQLLYFLGNSIKDVFVERGFLPWFDLKEKMEEREIPLLSIETSSEPKEFPLISFTLPTPLHFTNLIYALNLAKIPLKWSERNEKDPIILAGGMACSNPAPLLDILDVIAIGDGEILFPKILEVFKEKDLNRFKKLEELAKIEGLLVPPLNKLKTKRVIVKDLKETFLFTPILTAFPPVHMRFTQEIMRGCPWGCRFCQAGFWYRPYREANLEEIFKHIIEKAPQSGFKEVGLLSLSSSDISSIFPFCKNLMDYLEPYKISLSMPSLRIDSTTFPLLQIIQKIRKSALTFAPETGESLRKKIGKDIKDKNILEVLIKAKDLGWKRVKFYFMLGLPFEEERDLKEIIDLIKEVKKIGFPSISLNISNFIPKPWTPFQWHKMEEIKNLFEKQKFLRKNLPYKNIKISTSNPYLSHIEERYSRGNKKFGDILIKAYFKGYLFDNWEENYDLKEYLSILPENEIDIKKELPWEENIEFDIKKEFFSKEFENSKKEIATIPCHKGCSFCMGDCKILKKEYNFEKRENIIIEEKEKNWYRFLNTYKDKDSEIQIIRRSKNCITTFYKDEIILEFTQNIIYNSIEKNKAVIEKYLYDFFKKKIKLTVTLNNAQNSKTIISEDNLQENNVLNNEKPIETSYKTNDNNIINSDMSIDKAIIDLFGAEQIP